MPVHSGMLVAWPTSVDLAILPTVLHKMSVSSSASDMKCGSYMIPIRRRLLPIRWLASSHGALLLSVPVMYQHMHMVDLNLPSYILFLAVKQGNPHAYAYDTYERVHL